MSSRRSVADAEDGPFDVPAELEVVRRIAAEANNLGVVAVTRDDGTIHASLVSAGVINDPDSHEPSIGCIVGGSATKLRLMRRVRRATIVFQSGFAWVSVEGSARITGPDDIGRGVDAGSVPPLLRRVFLAAGGNHENWSEFDRVMAMERRAAVFVRVERILTNG